MTDSVTYSAGYKRALPGYENVTPFFSITRDVPADKTEDEVIAEVVAKVESLLEAKIAEIDADVASRK